MKLINPLTEVGAKVRETRLTEVLLIDDDAVQVAALVEGLGQHDIHVIGVTTSIEAVMQVADLEPSCILIDLKMPDVDGYDLLKAVCEDKRHVVVVLSAYVDVQSAVDAMRIGAIDVVQKPTSVERIVSVLQDGWKTLEGRIQTEDLTFTRRERQVAELLVQGMTAKQIALKLDLSHRTIEFFRANLMRKTQSPNSAALASALTRIGFS